MKWESMVVVLAVLLGLDAGFTLGAQHRNGSFVEFDPMMRFALSQHLYVFVGFFVARLVAWGVGLYVLRRWPAIQHLTFAPLLMIAVIPLANAGWQLQ